jgi:hypothetical protein
MEEQRRPKDDNDSNDSSAKQQQQQSETIDGLILILHSMLARFPTACTKRKKKK